MTLPTNGGMQNVLCLKLDFVPLWLAKISITPTMKAERPELVSTLKEYQLRAKDVLAAAFLPAQYSSDFAALSPELQMLKLLTDTAIRTELREKEQAEAIEAVNQKVDGIREIVVLDPNAWRTECRKLLTKIANGRGGDFQGVATEVYSLLERRAGVDLDTRLKHKRERMRQEGSTGTAIKKANKTDVIAEDKKLVEIYTAIVKEMAVKYLAVPA